MADAEIPLFRAFPALARALPRHPFVQVPTPVEPLRVPGAAPGSLFVKRDDRSCPLYGGNKPRKLEFVIGRALERGCRTLVTTGGLGTNHGLATTILGRAVGLRAVLVLVDQPATEGVRETLRLQCAFGAEQIAARNVPGAAVAVLRALARAALRGERPVLVPTGGSSPLGDVGFVSAAFELAEQVRAGALPEPVSVVLPIGSGGSMAGLVLGLRLAGLSTRVEGVLVTDILPPSPARLARAARATLRLLCRADASVPRPRIVASDFHVVRRQLGPGYGAPTPAATRAVKRAADLGLRLETTYSGKALAEILARLESGSPDPGPTLFWDTYNGVDVAAAAPRRVAEAELPPAILRALARASR